MKLIIPKYYNNFICKGGVCSDNCCIGWEIDIDGDTLGKYNIEVGDFGEHLRETIASDCTTSHFILSGERCPHLNSDNLCNLILEKNHSYLCEICREHPRFYTTLGDFTFGGVGMCCEAAAELILTNDTRKYETVDNSIMPCECDGELFEIMLSAREKTLEIMSDKNSKTDFLIKEIFKVIKEAQIKMDRNDDLLYLKYMLPTEDLYAVFEDMEFMSDELPKLLQRQKELKICEFENKYLQNIFEYFLNRYIPKSAEDGYILGKFAISSVSVLAISSLFSLEEDLTLERAVYLSKLYSKEIEYNEENIEKLEEKTDKILSILMNSVGLL